MSDWFLYVVKCSDETYYTGISTDVERRVKEHNGSKKGAKYTSCRRPVSLLAFWEFENRSAATIAEHKFKKLNRPSKTKRINTYLEDQES